jgi:hypothetical protein
MPHTRRYRRYRALENSMADTRSGQVEFVSHCLLNQNTRSLGGAVCRGVVSAAICPCLQDGTGSSRCRATEPRSPDAVPRASRVGRSAQDPDAVA